MKPWQKYWLYLVIFYSLVHLARDIMQSLGVSSFLSEVLVKENKPELWLYHPVNTYFIEIVEIVFSGLAFKDKKFSPYGRLTVFIAVATFLGFIYYWFFI